MVFINAFCWVMLAVAVALMVPGLVEMFRRRP